MPGSLPSLSEQPVPWALCLLAAALVLATLVRWVQALRRPGEATADRMASIGTWWMLAILFSAAVVTGTLGVSLLMGLGAILGLHEFARMLVAEHRLRAAIGLLYVLVPITFAAIVAGVGRGALSLVPMASVVLIALAQVFRDTPETYVRTTGGLLLASVTLIYGLGHAALLPAEVPANMGDPPPVAWFLYLVILTEMNDIGQALVGRAIGRHKITPHLSPNKSWEGLLGGLVTTVVLSCLLAPWLTTLSRVPGPLGVPLWPVVAGAVISVAGFLGDLNVSGVKRFVGVKDSSHALPGMGGVLDRLDSLTLTAPCFYWIVVLPHL